MSKELKNSTIEEFMGEVKQDYQQDSEILVSALAANGALVKRNVKGRSVSFPYMGRLFMGDRGASQTQLTPANVEHGRQTLILKNRALLEYTDIFDTKEVDFDEQAELAKAFGKAMAQDKDQSAIDSLTLGSYAVDPAPRQGKLLDNGGTPEALTVKTIKLAQAHLDSKSVPTSGRIFLLSALSHAQLLEDQRATSKDYQNNATIVEGRLDYICGFKIVMIPDAYLAGKKILGLPIDGDIHTCYAIHAPAMALAYAELDDLTIQWENKMTSHSVLAMLRLGSLVRDNEGVVKILNDITKEIV